VHDKTHGKSLDCTDTNIGSVLCRQLYDNLSSVGMFVFAKTADNFGFLLLFSVVCNFFSVMRLYNIYQKDFFETWSK